MPKKILVIDDDPKMLVLEKTILVQGGFSVETASDGVEGLEKLQAGTLRWNRIGCDDAPHGRL